MPPLNRFPQMAVIEEGRISSIVVRSTSEIPAHARVLDYPGATLAPAFFDVHIHGAAGHDLMEATPEVLQAVGSFLASRGTGGYLATTVTAPGCDAARALRVGQAAGRAIQPGAGLSPGHSSGGPVSVASEARRAARGVPARARYCRLRPPL